ncbi:oligopeptide/dipeptide ABC transporter ATPase subunit [Paenibacillus alvei TS-15]|jgi:peptide/nickel transport system ATP-binding protein|uniref:Oligopeptide/dipeptide ABC transporter ATPase subunit n=2 Tax=Paenibacillus TaxID=44249 RepID=S9TX18_PAEAL|nr:MULTISPECIES: dipeptide ABC transporter ATP-binding protein [Paenibacillus]EPY06776.1 oligopeptide/dipeptide ABC transporter ATPase subunit [Paenibacillus alvei TS-15]MCM3291340.1 dipeptide ABC transporter ATP-binding protein [Paenibacillus sp. MER 180]MDT8978405.1 dipeptide ABC transporter ATP-binding protein [Paenibacillus sp. chi10]OBY77282.1 peptide ABC transporter substrate-binding protein [Paenibacillus sp. KS1]GAV14244.1 oligopeptide transport ATP-binding protein AppF [Paenibacillus 
MAETLLEVKHLKKYFPITSGIFNRTVGHVKAVDDISFTIKRGETFGLVGESGSGKSTVGRTIIRLLEKTEGEVKFQGIDIYGMQEKELRKLRPKMQLIFQDPYSSLNPRVRVGDAIGEALLNHGMTTKEEVRDRVLEVMEACGLSAYQYDRFPHEFSGGQRQRIGIARALILDPDLIIADEPVSALDVSIQAQIINLFRKLQKTRGLTYLFISHDLSVVEHLCDRIGVMYLGTMMETASRDELFRNPLHPYTKALLSAVPIPIPKLKRERIVLQGDIPNPANPPSGCKFHTRCPFATDICREQVPVFRDVGNDHQVACHLV